MENIKLYLVMGFLGIILFIIIYKLIVKNILKEIESQDVSLKIVNKYKRFSNKSMGSRGSNRREKYFFTLKYNNIVDVIEVDSYLYNSNEINDEINGYYKIYKDIRGRNKVKIEL